MRIYSDSLCRCYVELKYEHIHRWVGGWITQVLPSGADSLVKEKKDISTGKRRASPLQAPLQALQVSSRDLTSQCSSALASRERGHLIALVKEHLARRWHFSGVLRDG